MSLKFGTSGDKKFRELIMNTGEYTEDKEVLKARLVLSVDSTDWSRDDKELALKFGISWLFGFETKEIYGHLLDTDNFIEIPICKIHSAINQALELNFIQFGLPSMSL